MTDPNVLAGRYRLDRLLGEGAMGRVWLGYDLLIHRRVAIKQLLGTAPGADMVERALREARSAGSLLHPNVVAVYDLLLLDGLPHVVMEYIDGTTLADRMAAGIPPEAEVVSIGGQVAAGLQAAHQIGIIHRDIKPANILIDKSGTAKLADFGIARIETNPGMTGTGMLIGTIAYMAPEVAMGERIGPPADVWSLGATLFAAVEGRLVYQGTSPVSILSQLITQPVPPLSHRSPLGELIAVMLDRDPARRPSAAQAHRRLAELAAPDDASATVKLTPPARPQLAGPPAVAEPPRPRPNHRKTAVLAALVGVLVLGVIATVLVVSRSGPGHPAARGGTSHGTAVTHASTPTSDGQGRATTGTPAGTGTTPATVGLASAHITDVTGDGEPDVKSVDWRASQSAVTISVHFAALLPAAEEFYIFVSFDTDNKPTTGCNGAELDVDYYSDGTPPIGYSYTSACKAKETATGATARKLSDGIEVTIPRAVFASSGAAVHFSALAANLNNSITDYVPAIGASELKIALG